MALKAQLTDAITKRDIAKANLETKQLERQLKISDALASGKLRMSYDATNGSYSNQRKQVSPEMNDEAGILDERRRLTAIARGRDLHRNDANARTIFHQFELHDVGIGPKMQAHTDNEKFNETFASFVNSNWAKNCDARNMGDCLADFLMLTITAIRREGDALAVFDDFSEDDGKLIWFEADQLVSISNTEWKKEAVKRGYTQPDPADKRKRIALNQKDGVIYDNRGRPKFFCVTAKHGISSAKFSDVTIIPVGSARLVRRPFRFNQHRGIGEILTVADDLQDIKEMRKSELQSAKRVAQEAIVIKADDSLESALARAGIDADALTAGTGTGTDEATITVPKRKYESLEAYSGGAIQAIGKDDDVKVLTSDRPNPDVNKFAEDIKTAAGAAMGLPQLYSTLIARKSYTAARAEILLASVQFMVDQKFLERHLLDWLAVKIADWCFRHEVTTVNPADMNTLVSWTWQDPILSLDPVKEIKGMILSVKLGKTTWQEMLGPEWKKKLTQLATEIHYMDELGILEYNAIRETVAGAPLILDETNSDDNNLQDDQDAKDNQE